MSPATKESMVPLDKKIRLGDQLFDVAALGWTGGERYYWLIDQHGTVAMYPWFVVEGEYEDKKA